MSGFAEIHNFADAVAWDNTGNFAKPILRWSTTDPDSDAVTHHQVRIYTASSGGVAAFDSTKTAGNPGFINANYAMPNRTARWWTIETWDALGESSGESTRTEFKVCWGQVLYEFAVPGGATSSGWTFSAPTPAGNTQAAFLFRYATGPASGSPSTGIWKPDVSTVVPNNYVNILVRLGTYEAGTQPALANMTFGYTASITKPDHYVFSPSGDWATEPATFRYGTKSLKFNVTDNTTDRYIYPFRVSAGDDIQVAPNTAYVFSAFAKTDGALGASSVIRLEIWQAGGLSTLLAQGTLLGDVFADGPGAVNNSNYAPEGWAPIHLRYLTPPGMTSLRPVVRFVNGGTGSGNAGWLDALMFEEGVIVSPWHPNQLAHAGMVEGYGLVLDSFEGAEVYARASDGATANLDDIVHGAGGGGGGGGADFVTVGTGTLITDIVTVP